MIKSLIVNADDFGLSPGVNAGIIEAFRHGLLTSASIMVNAPAFQEGVELARAHEGLGIGVHLNVLRGKAVLPPADIPSLVDSAGRFVRTPARLCFDISRNRADLDRLTKEFSAQIRRALDAGLHLTHVNSEKHVHMYPPIFARVVALAEEFGIRAVRWAGQYPRPRALLRCSKQPYKAFLLSLCARLCRKQLEGRAVISNDYFYGLVETGSLTAEAFRSILLRLKAGVTEIMCHPGYLDKDLPELFQMMGKSWLMTSRALELRVLTDPTLREYIDVAGVRLTHYGGL